MLGDAAQLEKQHIGRQGQLPRVPAQRGQEAARVRHRNGGQAEESLRRRGRSGIGDGGAPIVPHQVGLRRSQLIHCCHYIPGYDVEAVPTVSGYGRRLIAAQGDADGAVTGLGQRRQLQAVRARSIGKTVQAQHQRATALGQRGKRQGAVV